MLSVFLLALGSATQPIAMLDELQPKYENCVECSSMSLSQNSGISINDGQNSLSNNVQSIGFNKQGVISTSGYHFEFSLQRHEAQLKSGLVELVGEYYEPKFSLEASNFYNLSINSYIADNCLDISTVTQFDLNINLGVNVVRCTNEMTATFLGEELITKLGNNRSSFILSLNHQATEVQIEKNKISLEHNLSAVELNYRYSSGDGHIEVSHLTNYFVGNENHTLHVLSAKTQSWDVSAYAVDLTLDGQAEADLTLYNRNLSWFGYDYQMVGEGGAKIYGTTVRKKVNQFEKWQIGYSTSLNYIDANWQYIVAKKAALIGLPVIADSADVKSNKYLAIFGNLNLGYRFNSYVFTASVSQALPMRLNKTVSSNEAGSSEQVNQFRRQGNEISATVSYQF